MRNLYEIRNDAKSEKQKWMKIREMKLIMNYYRNLKSKYGIKSPILKMAK
ncbi:hypothetical protein NADRNF5_0376 [Nitrosopumilus adriaticus]|uniref:Uncharacterized protein n=1 Tax=Nitrosopumilus adriaticus TaxID=1580092 RepID=A0A0D5C0Y6_9ARCH|nr:hypothetical protein NADRNF5_0376 [Nitrosopumilus adriaticus]